MVCTSKKPPETVFHCQEKGCHAGIPGNQWCFTNPVARSIGNLLRRTQRGLVFLNEVHYHQGANLAGCVLLSISKINDNSCSGCREIRNFCKKISENNVGPSPTTVEQRMCNLPQRRRKHLGPPRLSLFDIHLSLTAFHSSLLTPKHPMHSVRAPYW